MQQYGNIDDSRNLIFPLFEKLFAPFIFESRNIEINYVYQFREPSAELFAEIAITMVNGCSTQEEFREKLSGQLNTSIQSVYDSLQQKNPTGLTPFLDHIRSKLHNLASAVKAEQITIPDETGKCTLNHQFKSFVDCKLSGPGNGPYNLFSQGIRYKAEIFAIVWREVIDDAINKVDLMQDLLLESITENQLSQLQTVEESDTFRPKLNLSVSQLGYFLNLLVRTGIIDLLPRQISSFIKWVCKHLQSKNQPSIQPTSLRNKYTTPDRATADSIETFLYSMIDLIKQDREKFSR
ncbi:MAG: hypothetical protein WCL00_11795 [Bacteroidota bacterium]